MSVSLSQRAAIAAAIDAAAAASQRGAPSPQQSDGASTPLPSSAPRVHVNRRGSIDIDLGVTGGGQAQPLGTPPPARRAQYSPAARAVSPDVSAESEHARRAAEIERMLGNVANEHGESSLLLDGLFSFYNMTEYLTKTILFLIILFLSRSGTKAWMDHKGARRCGGQAGDDTRCAGRRDVAGAPDARAA